MKSVVAYSGNSPSTLQTYSLRTCLFLICCSISRAFRGLRPNIKRPDVSLSRRWMVLRFLRLYSLAKMKTTVLWRYLPQGWTCKRRMLLVASQNEKLLLKQRVKLLSNRLFQFSVTVERIGDDVVNQHHFWKLFIFLENLQPISKSRNWAYFCQV